MRFRKKELRKLQGHTHRNNITKCYISRYRNLMLGFLVVFLAPGTYWGGPGNVVMARERKRRFTLLD